MSQTPTPVVPGTQGYLDILGGLFNRVDSILKQLLLNPQEIEQSQFQKAYDDILNLSSMVERAKQNPKSLVKQHQEKLVIQNQEDIALSKQYAIQEEQIMTNKIIVIIGLLASLGIIVAQHSSVLFS
jgi:hypothetical protein